MKTTKILTLLTAFVLILGLAACGTSKDNNKNGGNKKGNVLVALETSALG